MNPRAPTIVLLIDIRSERSVRISVGVWGVSRPPSSVSISRSRIHQHRSSWEIGRSSAGGFSYRNAAQSATGAKNRSRSSSPSRWRRSQTPTVSPSERRDLRVGTKRARALYLALGDFRGNHGLRSFLLFEPLLDDRLHIEIIGAFAAAAVVHAGDHVQTHRSPEVRLEDLGRNCPVLCPGRRFPAR